MKTLIFVILLFTSVASAQVDWTQKYFAGTDTSATLTDTASRKIGASLNTLNTTFRDWYQIILMPNDTIEVSYDTSFTTGKVERILPLWVWTSQKFNVRYFTNLYWRRSGSGTATIEYRIFGW